jgi:malonyl-CoA decarboxylase
MAEQKGVALVEENQPVEEAKEQEKEKSSFLSFRNRTMISVLRTWREMKGTALLAITGEVRPHLPKEDLVHLRTRMQACLNPRGGEVSARARTVELGRTYLSLNEQGRERFLRLLAEDFRLDDSKLKKAITKWEAADNYSDKQKAEAAMREALITPRSIILRQFNSLPDGFKFLVDMRTDVLPQIKKSADMAGLETDLKHILSAWFDIGLLDMVELSWNTPAAVLEKLIAYEAVHRIRSWDDLKNRLDSDRRIYAFFHNKMPVEPLIFVQVALVKGMSDSIQEVLDESAPALDSDEADTALFYSISNAQRGLAGISFGNFLIKRVVDKISREMKHIKHFATLSPIPGFRQWLDAQLKAAEDGFLLPQEEKDLLIALKLSKGNQVPGALLETLNTPWQENKELAESLKPVLMRLCAHYLLKEKRKQATLDPVAHFHLTNGARMERLNWLADISPKGMQQSAGMMVNYYYKLSEIDDNHEAYETEGEINASKAVRAFLKK